MKHITVALLAAVLLYTPPASSKHLWTPARAEQTKVLQASKDNTIIESPTGELSNGIGEAMFVGRTGQSEGGIRRGLIAFNIASALPAGARITSVKLRLRMRLSASGPQAAQVSLRRVLADWGQGKSKSTGRGDVSTEGDATWIHTFYPKRFWSHPGGDYATLESASQKVEGVGIYNWGSTPRMVADVQGWLDTPAKNFGWLLLGDEKAFATAKVFHSRETTGEKDNAQKIVVTPEEARPELTVTFVVRTRRKK